MTRNTSFTHGETWQPRLRVVSGDASGAVCRMALKPSRYGTPPPSSVPAAAEIVAQYVDHIDPFDDTSLPGFVGLLTGSLSAAVLPGWYSMDARLDLASFVIQTDYVRVLVENGVTGPASSPVVYETPAPGTPTSGSSTAPIVLEWVFPEDLYGEGATVFYPPITPGNPSQLLSGTILGSGSVSGSLTVARLLAGAVACEGAVSGALTVEREGLSGSITGSGTVTGALTVARLLSGSIAGSGVVTGDLTVEESGEAIGGITIGTPGDTGTIYEGFTVAAGEEFDTLDMMRQYDPAGKLIPSHRRRGRRSIGVQANDFYWTPDFTGHRDANRGVAIGSSVNDLLNVSDGAVHLSTRLATTLEQSLDWDTTASTGPSRVQASSAIHSAGYQAVKWPCVIECRMRIPSGANIPAGGWPAFWLENVLPTWANTGEWDWEFDDEGHTFANFITGTSQNDGAISDTSIDSTDGAFKTYTMVATATQLKFYIDGVLLATSTKAPEDHVPGPMFWWLRNGVDLTPGIYNMTYNAAAWAGVTMTMDVEWVRLWTADDAVDLGYKGIVATINVASDAAMNATLPTETSLWGRDDLTEFLIVQPIEDAEPGMSQLPTSGAPNTWYGQTAPVGQYWGPTICGWNPTTRAFTGGSWDRCGRLVAHLVAWDDTFGGLAGIARVVVNVGPRINIASLTFPEGPVSFDLYAECDCGMLVNDGTGRAKTISVTGLSGSGLSYSDATGLITGTLAAAVSQSITISVTNSIGQTTSKTVDLETQVSTGDRIYADWTGPAWFDASDSMVTSGSTVTGLTNKRAGGANLTGYGTSSGRQVAATALNGHNALRITRDVADSSSAPRFSVAAPDSDTNPISLIMQGSDQPYFVLCVYKPTDTNTGFIWSWSDNVTSADAQNIALIRRASSASSVRRALTTATSNDVSWGSGQASGATRVVAVKHTGTAVTVWDNSLTPVVLNAAQDIGTFNNQLAFRLFAAESIGTEGAIAQVQCNLDFGEVVVESTPPSDADIQQAITDAAAFWGAALS